MQTHSPQLITKNLAFSHGRKVRLSSNFLDTMGFQADDRVKIVRHRPFEGFSVERDPEGSHKVYQRRYRRGRNNNPKETVMEFAAKSLIESQFPTYTRRFHVEMRQNKILFRPLPNQSAAIIQRFQKANPFTTFVGLTGGVDVHCLESLGFHTCAVLEYRPEEARDRCRNVNLTETNALNTLVNGHPQILLNEDIYHLDLNQLEQILCEAPPIGLMHYSIQCDDHSNAKSKKAKQTSIEQLESTVDMVVPLIEHTKLIQPAVLMVENVPSFASSQACDILTLQLRRQGYYVTQAVLDPRDYGGYQSRKRWYLVASAAPGFIMPKPLTRDNGSIWHEVEPYLSECRDITDSQLIKQREASLRTMPNYITPDSVDCPTILKSQDRIKDGVFIKNKGRILKPSPQLLSRLMSIPNSFNASWASKEIETEILGQSIDYALHHAVLGSVKDHIKTNFGPRTRVYHHKRS